MMIDYRQVRTLAFLVLIAIVPPNDACPDDVHQTRDLIRFAAGFPAAPAGAFSPAVRMPAANLAARTIVPLSLADKQAALKRLGVTTYSLQAPFILSALQPASPDGSALVRALNVDYFAPGPIGSPGIMQGTVSCQPQALGTYVHACLTRYVKGQRFLFAFRVQRLDASYSWDWSVRDDSNIRIRQPVGSDLSRVEQVYFVLTAPEPPSPGYWTCATLNGEATAPLPNLNAGAWQLHGIEITPLQ